MSSIAPLAAVAILTTSALAQMQPFAMDWQNNSGSPADVSFLLDAPAGKAGFIGIHDGHLAYPDGRRFPHLGLQHHLNREFPFP